MITVVLLFLLVMIGLPSMSEWLQKTQIRTAAETLMFGLQEARSEAIRRNSFVRFQLVTSLGSDCVLKSSATNWVVSMDDPSGMCDAAPSDTAAPRILQSKSGAEGAPNATVSATGGGAATAFAVFNGMGRLSGAGNIDTIDIANPVGGACQHSASAGPMRCLRVTIAPGGDVRLCDPKVTDASDLRHC